ncbi:hypothetical protein N9N97_01695 [Rickettsiaceae bacterium]|nr:hypothetical protein [Rickettsiaceae bacterium]
MKSVLLTRSESANNSLKKSLADCNYELLDCSLIDYQLLPIDSSILENYTDIIITSNFAANNIPDAPNGGMHAWVVGAKSAQILESKGYKIRFFAQDALTLRAQIPTEIHENTIYLSSNHITVNMPLHITRQIFYNVSYLESLSKEQILRYKQGVDYILLYSENCAKTLVKILLENNLLNYLENTTILAISSKVDRVVKHQFCNRVVCSGADLILEYLKK